jgi:hypothetical protein
MTDNNEDTNLTPLSNDKDTTVTVDTLKVISLQYGMLVNTLSQLHIPLILNTLSLRKGKLCIRSINLLKSLDNQYTLSTLQSIVTQLNVMSDTCNALICRLQETNNHHE